MITESSVCHQHLHPFVLQGSSSPFPPCQQLLVDICERQSDLSTSCLKGLIDGPIKSALPRDITQAPPHLCLKRRIASEEGSGQLSCHGDGDLRLKTALRSDANSEHGEKVTEPHGGLTSGAGDELQHKTEFSSTILAFCGSHISRFQPNCSKLVESG